MDMSTHTQFKMEIAAVSLCHLHMDTSTHTQLKMEIVAPPPNIDINTLPVQDGDCGCATSKH